MAGLEDVPSCDLNFLFSNASLHVKSIVSKLNENQMLQFYGLYKQATEGPCDKPKPSWYQMTEKQKWEAWTSVKTLDRETAMEKYVRLLDTVDASWRRETPSKEKNASSWVHHSVMKNDDEELAESNKNVFDWVKEGNLSKIESLTEEIKINELREDGLNLLHWAADRGSLDVVKYLIRNLKADVDVKDVDGQTPLHYASSCGHAEIVKYLLDEGADANLLDNEQQSAFDMAGNSQIRDLLKHFMQA